MLNFLAPFLSGSVRKRDELSDSENEENEARSPQDLLQENSAALVHENEFYNQSRLTLSQCLMRVLPDAGVQSPNVVIIGAQTVGKTSQIRKMVFHNLIDNQYFTSVIADQLLKMMKIGTGMVTRRPITIALSTDDKPMCRLKLILGDSAAEISDGVSDDSMELVNNANDEEEQIRRENFDRLVDRINQESSDQERNIYGEELKILISAPGLPNVRFTDLPGLVGETRMLNDRPFSIRELTMEYIKRPNTTVVVVESASIEDFETSLVSPMLNEIKNRDRSNIFENSVLVLSKADKIMDSETVHVMSLIEKTSPELDKFNYRYVVGVINQVRGPPPDIESYSILKEWYNDVLEYERLQFERYTKQSGEPISRDYECTTTAVFNRIDEISFSMVFDAIETGRQNLNEKIQQAENEILRSLAPPLFYYDLLESDPIHIPQLPDAIINGRSVIIKEVIENINKSLISYCKDYDFMSGTNTQFNKILERFPSFSKSNDLNDHLLLKLIKDDLIKEFETLINTRFKHDFPEHIFPRIPSHTNHRRYGHRRSSNINECLTATSSPFHRIDRYHKLCDYIKQEFTKYLKEACDDAVLEMSSFINTWWKTSVPFRVVKDKLLSLINASYYTTIVSLYEGLNKRLLNLYSVCCISADLTLFDENEDFKTLRLKLEKKPFILRRQQNILLDCIDVRSNEALRKAIEEADLKYSSEETIVNEFWNSFWSNAQRTCLNLSTSPLEGTQDDSMAMNNDAGGIITQDFNSNTSQNNSQNSYNDSNGSSHRPSKRTRVNDFVPNLMPNPIEKVAIIAAASLNHAMDSTMSSINNSLFNGGFSPAYHLNSSGFNSHIFSPNKSYSNSQGQGSAERKTSQENVINLEDSSDEESQVTTL
eukprot:gene9885-13295_t